MIDVCPRCRIQAPHRDGRQTCPRCGGPLQQIDAGPEAASRREPRSTRVYRSRHVRWVARRPPEAIPVWRPTAATGPRPIPRYPYLPQWGLHDEPLPPVDPQTPLGHSAATFLRALRSLSFVLWATAAAHLLRYVLLAVNRATPVPGFLAAVTAFLVLLTGLLALIGFVYVTVLLVLWLRRLRADAYRRHELRDPRPWWQLIGLAAVPLVNVVGLAVLLREVAAMRDDLDVARTRDRLTRLWVAWILVNAVAVVAVIYRIVAMSSGSIQTGADTVLAVVVSSAVSAWFARWAAGRLDSIFVGTEEDSVPNRRWVVAV